MRAFGLLPAISVNQCLQENVRTSRFRKIIITFLPLNFENHYFSENNMTTPIFMAVYNYIPNLTFLGGIEMLC